MRTSARRIHICGAGSSSNCAPSPCKRTASPRVAHTFAYLRADVRQCRHNFAFCSDPPAFARRLLPRCKRPTPGASSENARKDISGIGRRRSRWVRSENVDRAATGKVRTVSPCRESIETVPPLPLDFPRAGQRTISQSRSDARRDIQNRGKRRRSLQTNWPALLDSVHCTGESSRAERTAALNHHGRRW